MLQWCASMSDLTSPTLRIFKDSKDTISSVNHSQLYLWCFGKMWVLQAQM